MIHTHYKDAIEMFTGIRIVQMVMDTTVLQRKINIVCVVEQSNCSIV